MFGMHDYTEKEPALTEEIQKQYSNQSQFILRRLIEAFPQPSKYSRRISFTVALHLM